MRCVASGIDTKSGPQTGPSHVNQVILSPAGQGCKQRRWAPRSRLLQATRQVVASLLSERPASEPLSIAMRRVLEAMGGVFDRDREIILARGRLWFEVPALRARLWEELEKAQAFISGLIAERYGRDADDFELRITVMIVVMTSMEAMREWVRHDGKGSFVAMVNRALDLVDAGARLDQIASPPARA
jgi:hypothetical protein